MSRKYVLFILIAVLLVGLHASCCAQGRRERPGLRERGGQQFSLGVVVKEAPSDSPVKGMQVESVTAGGLGDMAGLKAEDIIVSLAGQMVKSSEDVTMGLVIIARMMKIGQDAEMLVVRDGKAITLIVKAGATDVQPNGPLLGVGMKDVPTEWGIEGVLISDVALSSPADDAGIMLGDIVTEVNGQPVKTASNLQKSISSLEKGHPYTFTVRRGTQSLLLSVTLREMQPSGVASSPSKRKLSDINVLKYAVIDPQSRVITLMGKYDQSYKTGPIPYYDLLNDAMRSPYPSFSLEPTKETLSGVDRIHKAIGADVQQMDSDSTYCNTWTYRLMNLILNDPALKRDRARFLKKGADAFQITEDEMLKVLSKSAGATNVSEDDMMPILGKILRGMGYEQVGAALIGINDSSQVTVDRLGISAETSVIKAKFNSGEISKEQASVEFAVLMESAILRGLRLPETDIEPRASNVLNGRMSVEDFQKYMEERVMAIIVDGVGLKMFHGLTLSHEVLSKLYNVPTPQVELVFKDVPTDSVLGDTLFRADYALKTICVSPDTKNQIPGFPTEMDYLYAESVKKGTRIPADVGVEAGHRLIPGEVKMRVSPSGNLISFDDAQVKIIGWVINTVGKRSTSEVANFIKDSTGGYGDYLTQHYEELSRVFPELHRIREAEKLIALARWAKANNYSIVVDKATGIRLAQSPTAVGFWQAVFTADQKEFSLTIIAEGGASFDKSEGEDWIKPKVDSGVTADISKQLVMSTVLAKQAADMAVDGNMEGARDFADKSARAMTGDIDLTLLPSLGDIPMPGEPAQTAVLSTEAISAIDENMRQVENAKVSMQKAADLEKTSPEDAAKLREQAEAQKNQAEANLKGLRDAMDSIKNDPTKINNAVVTIRGLGKVTPSSSTVATNTGSIVSNGGQVVVTDPQPTVKDDITPAQREKLLAELATLEKELDATKAQFGKLSKSIQQDQKQFDDWEKVARDGMERCSGVLYNLLMDASAAQLSDRYETMNELAKKLPNKPQDLIDKLGRIKNWFKAMSTTQAFKDVADVAAKDGKTLPEMLEEVRDELNIIASVTGLDKTVAGAAWKCGTNIVEMSYSFAQFNAAYDNIGQLDKNSDNYLKAVASLTVRMQALVKRINDIKKDLGTQQNNK